MFSLLNDLQIRKLAINDSMIVPFTTGQTKEVAGKKVISFGLSSYGYDMRVSDEFLIFNNLSSKVVDPKSFDTSCFVRVQDDEFCIIPPNSFVLARSDEYFKMPRDVMAICLGKSSYARCGIIINVTPLEPGWEGYLTIEISNSTPCPVKVYSFEGIGQLIFFRGDSCEVSYSDRAGKYQGQKEITLPKV